MKPAPPGTHPALESLTQLLLSFSSFPTQDPSLRWTQEDEKEEVGDADSDESGHEGGSWIETEHQFQSQHNTADPSPWLEEALSGSDADSIINGETDHLKLCSDRETQGQFNGETQEFESYPATPSFEGETASGGQRFDLPLVCIQKPPTSLTGLESTTPNPIQSQKSGQEQCTWKRRIRLGKIPDQREPTQGRVPAFEKAMRSYVDRKSGQVVAPEIGQEFDSLAEAFYLLW